MTTGQRFLVQRNDLTQTRLQPLDAAAPPAPGRICCRIAHFALTANNITYAVFGESMRYWQFSPAEDGCGCIPVWGFAQVEASACEWRCRGRARASQTAARTAQTCRPSAAVFSACRPVRICNARRRRRCCVRCLPPPG
jgi:hypothetical protein